MHLLAVSALALATLVAPHADPPPPGRVPIDVVTISGNGCGRGTVVSVAADNSRFTLDHGEVIVWVGGAARPTDARKNCRSMLRIHAPQGYTYALAPAVYRGWVHLEPGATATARFTHVFQGGEQHETSYGFTGPDDDYWERIDPDGPGLPCGQTSLVSIWTDLRVSLGSSNPAKSSYLATDSPMTEHHFTWKRCS
ncbi:DUF4360 domain-containing protein [Lentzea tibetensis]|uniref:DUF4360 domain-containing protein n=1 Tax=Lentzea tibetensis TaxID=2591470 RepID=A0A563F321_9PSEU|nr:DUF4360 domain-containing protein [Lentzea tibetensis]TWP53744.1 DUF4360 domain-containing protein [Lentzea tibetensis]